MADKGKHPSTEHHHDAAARHSAAAHHHYEAAHQHETGEHDKAKQHAASAHEHSEKAHGHSRRPTSILTSEWGHTLPDGPRRDPPGPSRLVSESSNNRWSSLLGSDVSSSRRRVAVTASKATAENARVPAPETAEGDRG